MTAVSRIDAERTAREDRLRASVEELRTREPAFSYSESEVQYDAVMEAEKHQPEKGGFGCSCGFVAWSIEHVVIKALRVAIPEARRTGP